MKRKYLIQITYAAPQTVIVDGREADRLRGELEWIANSREAARIWALGLSDCLGLIEVVSIWEVSGAQ